MKLLGRIILCSLASILLISCTPVATPVVHNYVINAVPQHVVRHRTSRRIILVAMPETSTVFNTTEMAYSLYPYQVAYFSKNQWAATPSQMLLPLLVESLQKTHAYKAVVTAPFLGSYDYLLNTQILDLRQTFTRHHARVRVSILVMLSGNMGGRVIATKRFSIEVPMRCVSPYYGVIATNQAVEILLRRIAAFCVRHRG